MLIITLLFFKKYDHISWLLIVDVRQVLRILEFYKIL